MPVDRASVARALADPESFGTTLLLAVAASYGMEPFAEEWEPEVLAAQLREDYGVSIPASSFSRLMAAAAVLTSDRFFGNLPDFIDLANALNGSGFDPRVFDPVSADEAAWAITEAVFIESFLEGGSTPEPSPDVVAYLGKVLDAEGILDPPDVLAIAGRDPDRIGRVLGEYADDPEIHASIYAAERAKSDAVSAGVRDRLDLLLAQVAALLNIGRDGLADLIARGDAPTGDAAGFFA